MYLFRNRNPKPGVFKAVNRYTGEVVFVRKVPGGLPLTIEYRDLLTNQLLFDSRSYSFFEVTPDDVRDYVLAEKEEVIAKHIAKQLGEGANENSVAVNVASGDKMNPPKKATMENLKNALAADQSIVAAIVAMVKQHPAMATSLVQHLHAGGHAVLNEDVVDLIKDPADSDNVRTLRARFKKLGVAAFQAVQSWVDVTPELEKLTIELEALPPKDDQLRLQTLVVTGNNNLVVSITPESVVVIRN